MSTSPPPGWYPDPHGSPARRYWNGEAWTEHVAVDPPTPPSAQTPGERPWWRRWPVVAPLLVLGLLLSLALAGKLLTRDRQDAGADAPAVTPVVPTPAAPTSVWSPPPAPTDLPSTLPTRTLGGDGPAGTSDAPSSQASSPGSTVIGRPFPMPDLTGVNLQEAQNRLQDLSGNPIFFSRSQDATGRGRRQVLDAGWTVCGQSTPAGRTVQPDDTGIVLDVVRRSEECP